MAKDCSAKRSSNKVFDDYECYLTQYLRDAKNLALLLDYDGTLTPLADRPDVGTMPPDTKAILEDLSRTPNVFVAIISGRRVDNLKEMVNIKNITYAGNHGLEVIYPNGSKYNHEIPAEFNDQVKVLKSNLEKSVVRDGTWIEDKGATLTFHFGETPEEKILEIQQTAREIMEKAGFKVGNAHLALDVKPKVEWNKGTVALMLLDRKYGENKWQGNVKVIVAGDDTSDEDVMFALKGYGATFRIAPNADIQTHAVKLLSSLQSVMGILQLVQKLFKK